ncbi:Type IV fimbrial biogenesis protein PilV [Methylophaga frappieri]|uniref:Type IV fimbrial biogenesis protein PilV n=1 Tax=Methylophaga frappieri (strain ATCC BAA-2434 / DSM 25690 / JAM7) TaxID=754477 RepID=I1YKL5_METFJ|nr:type IV pilus modification protein PilV [Methylophaga frappieri]AFJ03458.1 Type IV fimbrial biogenesis protein PilV [Methylophaga frappieri]
MKQKGFTLLEIMIAVFILALGVLALAYLQSSSLKTNQSAQFRSTASIMASDILERMRANPEAARDPEAAGDDAYNTALNVDPNTNDGICPASPAVRRDICQWLVLLEEELPEGDGSIDCDGRSPEGAIICAIDIQWTEAQSSGNLSATTFSYEGAL